MKNNLLKFAKYISVVLLLVFPLGFSEAAEQAVPEEESSQVKILEKSTETKLNEIRSDLVKRHEELAIATKALKKTKTPQEKKELEENIASLNQVIGEQNKAFAMIVSGGIEKALVEEKSNVKFDWQKDLMDILQPILSELKQLTEHKRKLENLKNSINFHQAQINAANEAMIRINAIDPKKLKYSALKKYTEIKTSWQKRVDEHRHLMEVSQLQMDEMLKPDEVHEQALSVTIKQFFLGRGATLIMAIFAALLVFAVMRSIQLFLKKMLVGDKNHSRRTSTRFFGIFYQLVTVLFSVAAVFIVFHERGDRVLQAVAIIILVVVILILKNSIPGLIGELRLLMNLGLVREGERVIYNGLPWLVESLNVFTKLSNPAIVGGTIKVPIQILTNLHSRKSHADEPWFPCRIGNRVILDDGVYGLVQMITMEGVVLRLAGGAEKSYGIGDFLGANPVNLSKGFSVASVFGIDYKHQERSTVEIPKLFEDGVRAGLQAEEFGEHLTKVVCEFDSAAASSLNYKIMVEFTGDAANSYNPINRAVQRLAVEICNKNNLDIPYNQLTVHYNQP
ncbi:MAG: hypothetical protein HQL70_06615 [Magnetococcales bacterium]|nr:hypothetical protein [Magnetococcales bacterium]